MTTLQLGLIVGGIVLVVGVIIYNHLQERRLRQRIAATFTDHAARERERGAVDDDRHDTLQRGRVEPTLRGETLDPPSPPLPAALPENPATRGAVAPTDDESYVHPVAFDVPAVAAASAELPAAESVAAFEASSPRPVSGKTLAPDPDVECIVILQPERPVIAGDLAAGLHARVGKPLRWLGRAGPNLPWQVLSAGSPGTFSEVAACMLLADRAGAASRPMIERFVRMLGEIGVTLAASFTAPDMAREAERAEALDRLCADLDVQIGLTLLKTGPNTIAGTRLRGVAEAAGFRLSEAGRFDWIQEDTGAVLYSLQNYRSEPFTADSLRLASTAGVVFILDVPRVADPVRVFDQMKLAAKRMTATLDAALVDDNRRPLDDAALASIRAQVQATAAALKEINIAPGGARALALFGG